MTAQAHTAGRRWSEIFPDLRATVLQDGHVDHITGPRCVVQMGEGPQRGLYLIAHTDQVLTEGTEVLVNERCGYPKAKSIGEAGQ